jgi:plasmid rolling circle replication initiator protein Rep
MLPKTVDFQNVYRVNQIVNLLSVQQFQKAGVKPMKTSFQRNESCDVLNVAK